MSSTSAGVPSESLEPFVGRLELASSVSRLFVMLFPRCPLGETARAIVRCQKFKPTVDEAFGCPDERQAILVCDRQAQCDHPAVRDPESLRDQIEEEQLFESGVLVDEILGRSDVSLGKVDVQDRPDTGCLHPNASRGEQGVQVKTKSVPTVV
jgi:hypothetical protein